MKPSLKNFLSLIKMTKKKEIWQSNTGFRNTPVDLSQKLHPLALSEVGSEAVLKTRSKSMVQEESGYIIHPQGFKNKVRSLYGKQSWIPTGASTCIADSCWYPRLLPKVQYRAVITTVGPGVTLKEEHILAFPESPHTSGYRRLWNPPHTSLCQYQGFLVHAYDTLPCKKSPLCCHGLFPSSLSSFWLTERGKDFHSSFSQLLN